MIYEEPGETPGTKRAITEGGLPPLIGADAELAQAREIRRRILVEADDVLTRLRSDEIITEAQVDTDIVSPRQVTVDQVHSAEYALNRLRNETQAVWWIAQSGRSAGDILAESMKAAANQP
jgi:hypothetical protein